jgi:carboxypeptidase T
MKGFLLAGLIALGFCQPAAAQTNRNYAGVKAALKKINEEHQGVTSLFTLAASDSKDQILGIRIGNGPQKSLVVATHHGNEYGSTEIALAFAESAAADPLGSQTVFVIPVLNVTGYDARTREERDARGISRDPNRDYPGPCGTEGPFRLKSTKSLADFVAREKIVASATLHTAFPTVVYPWGIATRDLDTGYTDTFRKLAAFATEDSHYQIGNSTEVMYAAAGAFEDYAFWKHGVWSMLFELGYSHSPSDRDIETMVRINVPGLRRLLLNAPVLPAPRHEFTGACDMRLSDFDRHDE